MKSFLKLFAAVSFALILSACATAGSGRINWDNARQVKPGMTQQQVRYLMGDPYMVRTVGKDEVRWVWVHVNLFSGTQSAALTFKNGVLLEAFQVPDSFK